MDSLKSFNDKFQIIRILVQSVSFILLLLLPFVSYGQPICEGGFSNKFQSPEKFVKEGRLKKSHQVEQISPQEHAKKSIWKINIGISSGTGFFISPNQFITNFHVIRFLQHTGISRIYLSQADNSQTLKVKRILGLSALHDLALLEIEESVDFHLQIREESPQEGVLFIAGYPNGQFNEMRNRDTYIGYSDSEYNFYTDYDEVLFGISGGGPVLDEERQVVGVVFASGKPEGMWHNVHSVKLNYLQDFIKEGAVLNC